jgi:hypothetical protein
MKISRFLTRAWLLRLLVAAVAIGALTVGIQSLLATARAGMFAAVPLTGVHHMGDKFNIPQFYADGYDGSNVGREGGGGRNVCCVLLPRKWRPGLSVEVRWAVDDFTHEKPAEVEVGNFDSVEAGGIFIAQVPVERYELAEHLWVHFFAGGKVRVVSSSNSSWGNNHPIEDGDPHAIDSATAGRRVTALFSAAELAEINRKDAEHKQKYGDWR